MRLIGHVGCAVTLAAPFVYFKERMPELIGIGDEQAMTLFAAAAFFGTLPDFDIILQRFTPIRHRGYLSHSIFTLILVPGLILAAWHSGFLGGYSWLEHLDKYATPCMAFMAFVGILAHLLGDSVTISGIPLWVPKQPWHFPGIGGYAAFDNPILNAIPLAVAGYILVVAFNASPNALRHFGGFRPLRNIFPPQASGPQWSPRKDWNFGIFKSGDGAGTPDPVLSIDKDETE